MGRKDRKKKSTHALIWIIFLEILLVMAGLAVVIFVLDDGKGNPDPLVEETVRIDYIEETEETEEETCCVPKPEVDEQLLTVNEWSRPGKKIESLDYIVIHYLANPKTTAQENHDYFESLKDLQNVSMSANYIVGIEGEIIHCVPDDEVAYASNSANSYSISIENCHLDKTGRLTEKTYQSLVNLTAYLSEYYGLGRDQIIRHYDVTGKDCPKYFVDHPDKWEAFLDDVMQVREDCRREAEEEAERIKEEERKAREEAGVDELTAFLESNAAAEPSSD